MTRRSALLTGLAVLIVLLGGQTVGTWQRHAGGAPLPATAARPPAARTTAPPAPDSVPGSSSGHSPAGRPATGGAPAGRPTRPNPRLGDGPLAAMGVKRVTGGRGVALTFDDGPHPHYTPQVLDILRENRVKAVFCLVGTEVRRHPELVVRIAREGHTLCNHSWHHELNLGSWSLTGIRQNLDRTNAEIRHAVPGAKIPYYRQPGGRWTPAVARVSRALGMTPLGWSVDPLDWRDASAPAVRARVLAQSKPGSIVLLHDAGGERAHTIVACRSLVPALKRRFYLVQLR